MKTTTALMFVAAMLLAMPSSGVRADEAADSASKDSAAKKAAEKAWEKQAKAEIAYFKKNAKRAKDDATYADLLMAVASTEHPVAADYLGKLILKDQDIEHQLMAASVLSEFKRNEKSTVAAGDALVKVLDKNKKLEIDVVDTAVDSVGKLKHEPAVPIVCEILKKGGDPYLLLTCVRALGRIDSWQALPTLLGLWERHPVGYSWETGEVKVDTGASGTADQEAAEAAWKAKYGNAGPRGKPPLMLKVYIEELAKACTNICDEEIGQASDLRRWMVENRLELKKLGIDIPKYKGPTKRKGGLDFGEDPDDDADGDGDGKGKKD